MAKLIFSPAPCTVRKSVGLPGWIVEGELAVIRGEVVNQPFYAYRPTREQAVAFGLRQDRRNAEAIAELEAETAAEKSRVAQRKAAAAMTRAEKAARQFAFDF